MGRDFQRFQAEQEAEQKRLAAERAAEQTTEQKRARVYPGVG